VEFLQLMLILPWVFAFVLTGRFTLRFFGITHLKGISSFTFNYWAGFSIISLILFIYTSLFTLNLTAVTSIFSIAFLGFLPSKTQTMKSHFKSFDQGHLLSSLFVLACLITLPAAMTAPLAGSSLEYHLAIPKAIAETGEMSLTMDSFIQSGPLLSHNISAAAYLAGGEKLMMLHGWSLFLLSGLAVFTLARRRLRVGSSWIFTSLVMSLPALTYSAGSGIIEPRLLGLVTLAAFSLIYYARSEKLSWLVLSALFIGTAAQMHIIGIFTYMAFLITAILIQKDFGLKKGLSHFALFTILCTFISAPFYLWAYSETGKVLIPFMNDLSGMTGWSDMQQALYNQEALTQSNFVERTKSNWLFTYPLAMTLKAKEWGTSHLGLGPLFLMSLIPGLILVFKRFSYISPIAKPIGTLELHVYLFMTFYALWFFYGMSMEPQSLIPMLPLLMLPAWVMAETLIARSSFAIRSSIITATFAIMAVQYGISSKLNQPAIALFFKKIPLETYIAYNMPEVNVAQYLKRTMNDGDKVLYTQNGKMNYVLGRKGFYAPAVFQEKIPVAFGTSTDIINSALSENITMWVTENDATNPSYDSDFNAHKHLRKLINYGCFREDGYIEPVPNKSFYVYRFIHNCQGRATL